MRAETIRQRLDYWTLVLGPKFSKTDRQAINLKGHYSIEQVEYCRNLIFRRNFPIHKLFERSCNIGLLRMIPDKITQIFGFRIHKKLRGELQTVLEKVEHGHHVFRACGKNAVLRMCKNVCGPLAHSLFNPPLQPQSRPVTKLEGAYRQADYSSEQVLRLLAA